MITLLYYISRNGANTQKKSKIDRSIVIKVFQFKKKSLEKLEINVYRVEIDLPSFEID